MSPGKYSHMVVLLVCACACVAPRLRAAETAPAAGAPPASNANGLSDTLDAIFNKHEYSPKSVQLAWQKDGALYTVLEPAPGGSGTDIAGYDTASGKRSVVVPAALLTPPGDGKTPLGIDGYAWSPDQKKLLVFTNSRKVWRLNTRGDYWVFDEATGKLHKLGGDAPESTLMFATFSPDSTRVAYVRANNLYVEELAAGKITQLTSDGSADIINGTSDWVSEEELRLRNCYRWSPDGKSIAYWQFDQSGVGEYTLINDTNAEYPELMRYKYPQPGTRNSAVRAGIVAATGGPTRWIQLEGNAREHYIAEMEWAGNSDQLMVEYLDRPQKHNRLMLADAHSGEARVFFEDSDEAWVDAQPLEWIHGGASPAPDLLWVSERDGWRHAYRVDRKNGQARLLTHFEGDVIAVTGMDAADGWLYFVASPEDAVRQYLFRTRLDGTGTPERVTPREETGSNSYNFAPDGKWAVHTFSTFTEPPRSEIVSLPAHQAVRTLADNHELAEKARTLMATPPEFFKVKVAGGVTLDGWMIRPPAFDPAKKYPVLAYVYGEPAGATVVDGWGGARGLFHGAIAQQGYLVVSFDNQGTPAPRGRQWRKCIYEAVGVLSSAQQAQAIQALAAERPYIDTARMAIWGWSGGGSNTLNMMFRYPGVYATGIAVAPVAQRDHYDSIYEERYMNVPSDNKLGYEKASPINFAQNLSGHLLVVHGSGDDNVHFQGTELLVNKLVELGKQFDFMEYPNRTHSISEGPGTSFHLHSLIARYLEDHVPAGGVVR